MIHSTPRTYAFVIRSKVTSNHLKKRFFSPCFAWIRIAASAGDSVSATMPENTTETAIVTANCLYSAPVMPPRNATGMNTAFSTSTIAMTGPLTSSIARFAASFADSLNCTMFRSVFSTTTIASSTTRPIARIMPNSVSMLIEKPNTSMPIIAPRIDTGTASVGMMVSRRLCRNMNTTSTTSTTAS